MSFKNTEYLQVVYFEHGGAGTGGSSDDPLALADNTAVCTIPAGAVIESCDFVVTTSITGVTDLLVGDATTANGFVATGTVTWATAGAYIGAGAYIAAEAKKYYAAATDVACNFTTASTAGAGYLVLKGFVA